MQNASNWRHLVRYRLKHCWIGRFQTGFVNALRMTLSIATAQRYEALILLFRFSSPRSRISMGAGLFFDFFWDCP
jgi:hypothetical protein